MTEAQSLPTFRYYRDPCGDGLFARSAEACPCCGRVRGWAYRGHFYAGALGCHWREQRWLPPERTGFCPWCVADGGAAARFGGCFNEVWPEMVAEGVATLAALEELAWRTPRFPRGQDWAWPTAEGDFCEYVERSWDGEHIIAHWAPAAVDACLANVQAYWPEYTMDDIRRGTNDVAFYLFRAPVSGAPVVREDMT